MGKRDENKERKRDRITEREIGRNKETQKERELKKILKAIELHRKKDIKLERK